MTTPRSRREFLGAAGVGAAAAALPPNVMASVEPQRSDVDTKGASSPQVAPVDTDTIAAAERLAGVTFSPNERQMMAETLEEHLQRLRARQSHGWPQPEDAPALTFDPRLNGMQFPDSEQFTPTAIDPGRPPSNDLEIAFAPVSVQSKWLRNRYLTSQHLTRVYLERMERWDPRLQSVITRTEKLAMQQARQADIEIAAGRYRGPLHGIPWGAKDLLDTAGIPTTWGATPYKDRVPSMDAVVVERLREAGAVLVAKLSLGALAYNDIWFGGHTRNPWNLDEGSSGSSAGSAAATAAGLVGFSLGTETYGSIVSPCMRCGATGLRPTFGRVPRTGAMPLCWSLDKIGPICRTVEDCMLVLHAINGSDPGDASSLDMPLSFDAAADAKGLRVGYSPAWFEGPNMADSPVIGAATRAGLELVEIDLPDWPYDVLLNILLAESAAVFENLTRTDQDDQLVWQDKEAWPNTFRQTWFVPAIEYVQADRFRRQVMKMMAEKFETVDAIMSPSFAASLLLITNNTGHPSLTLRSGWNPNFTPRCITLWGRLFDEGTLCRIGMALEKEIDEWRKKPPL